MSDKSDIYSLGVIFAQVCIVCHWYRLIVTQILTESRWLPVINAGEQKLPLPGQPDFVCRELVLRMLKRDPAGKPTSSRFVYSYLFSATHC